MANVSDELIELRGLRFHYRDWAAARADAPTLLLLHGYTGHARSWDAFAQALTNDYRVLALDQRGHGETGWAPPDQYGTDDMVADLAAFVAALGLSDFVLLGLSMGGSVAIHYAATQPTQLDRLVIVDIAPEIAVDGLSRTQAGVAQSDVFASREAAFERARGANPVAPDATLRHRVYQSLMRTETGEWTYRYDRALRDSSVPRSRPSVEEGWAAVAKINVPTLVVRGAKSDILDREIAQKMVGALADGVLAEVPAAGHSVPLDQPEGFLVAVRSFL